MNKYYTQQRYKSHLMYDSAEIENLETPESKTTEMKFDIIKFNEESVKICKQEMNSSDKCMSDLLE